ncbi:MAG: hypothetical protein NXI20_19310 [bacterium]|nr:hypothetical protein [bacterium]
MEYNDQLIPLKEIEDSHEFWRGSRFRQYKVGLKVAHEKDDYYEYMLISIPGEYNFMLLSCVEGYKAWNTLAKVKTTLDNKKLIVSAKAMKYCMGIENTYFVRSH